MKKATSKELRIILAVILVLAAALTAEIFRSNFRLTVSCYQAESSKITDSVRILQLTDLHNAEFGENNADLVAQAAALEPDIILFTGDLVTGWIDNRETAAALLKKLTVIAPVYVSIGNHEQQHEAIFGTDLTALYESAGATVLEYEWVDVQAGTQTIRIGGFSGIGFGESYIVTGDARPQELEFLRKFQDTDSYTLLMNHYPVGWMRHGCLEEWEIDLVFSGHVHGGQFVLPGIGGVYGPDLGFFPGRLEGLFPSEDGSSTLVLSRGLGNSVPIPRLNNPPQLLILDIIPAEE